MEKTNYDIMLANARKLFLQYDQKKIIRKLQLSYDAQYLYIKFLHRDYRICRESGLVEWSEDGFLHAKEGDFQVSMTLFDLLCYSKEGCSPAGTYALVTNLKGTGYTGNPGQGIYDRYLPLFDQNRERLVIACEAMGGKCYPVGDVAYLLPVFGGMHMLFQFWESDDEFPAQIKMKWDEHVLQYMHFETVHYAMGHVLERMKDILRQQY